MDQNALGSLTERLPAKATPITTSNTAPDLDGTDTLVGVRRFDTADSKTTVLDTVEQGVVADAEWYQIEYHECEDDAGQPIPDCPGWTVERSHGTVPGDV